MISRGGTHRDDDVRHASLLGEAVVRSLFRGREEKLVIIRTDGAVGTAALSHAAGSLSGDDGTVWEAREAEDSGEIRLERVDTDSIPEGVSGVLMEISRAMTGGETEKVSGILIEFTSGSGVEEHESG